jgi:hypothetical protein
MRASGSFSKSGFKQAFGTVSARFFRLRKMLLLNLLLFLSASSFSQSADPLERAVKAIGGEEALTNARSVSMALVGTTDLKINGQGYFVSKSQLQRRQETLVIDERSRKAVLRMESVNSDGSPTVWRYAVVADDGFQLNVKTGRIIRMDKQQAAAQYESLRWRMPQLALAEMKRRSDKLNCEKSSRRQTSEVCRFETESGLPFSVLFSRQTGQLAAFEYTAATVLGPKLMRYEFKPYVRSGIGLLPSGYRFLVGGELYADLDLLDAQTADTEQHPWLEAPPADSRPVSRIAQQPFASAEEVAPGVWFVRNIAGYNSMFAQVGDCIAVFDAPASFIRFGDPLPSVANLTDRTHIMIDKIKEVTGKKVCYIVPTHHHADHIGGIPGFVRAGATVITTRQGEILARAVVKSTGTSALPKIQIIQEKMTLGEGNERIDIWAIKNDPHAETMLFVHFPGRNIAFEGDISDYFPSARNLLNFIGHQGLKIENLFKVHSAQPASPKYLLWEEPFN